MEMDLIIAHLRSYGPFMTTMTLAQPTSHSTAAAARPRLITAPLVRVLAASFGALTSFYLPLSVTPMMATAAGSAGSAGIVTGLLMFGGVLAELASPRLMARFGVRRMLAVGLLLLGAPALVLMVADQLSVVMAVCFVRGLGFGLTVVATGSLAVALVPPERRGEGLGLCGLASCLPGIVALPAGVWLVDRTGYGVVFALAGLAALLGLAAQFGSSPAPAVTGSADAPSAALLAGLRCGSQLRPAFAFATMTIAAGIIVAFLPLAGVPSGAGAGALLVQALVATLTRWLAGRHGDRHGHGRLLVPGIVTAAAGMMLLATAAHPVGLLAGAVLFGAGFGVSQSVTLAMMLERVAPSGYSTVNAVWNLAYDLGYGAGPVAFGALVGHTGYPAAFAITGVAMLAALVPAQRDRASAKR
jgi:predicted MFS family arabinose efflux permease